MKKHLLSAAALLAFTVGSAMAQGEAAPDISKLLDKPTPSAQWDEVIKKIPVLWSNIRLYQESVNARSAPQATQVNTDVTARYLELIVRQNQRIIELLEQIAKGGK